MENILIVLTGTIMGAFYFIAYRLGYREGKAHRDTDAFEVNKGNAEMLKQYADFIRYNGEERS